MVVTVIPVSMHHIGHRIKNISTEASSDSWQDSKEVSHATLTPLRRFDAFAGRAESLGNNGFDIVLVLRNTESELKVELFLMKTGVGVYAVDLAAELEEGDSTGSVIEFVWLDVNNISKRTEKWYRLSA